MIEALLNIRIPELWVTPITEKYDVSVTCQIGGYSSKAGWGSVTMKGDNKILNSAIEEIRNHPSVGGVTIKVRQSGSTTFIVDVVKCKACEVLMKAKAFMVFPVSIQRGRMKWLLITDDNPTVGKIVDALEDCECDVKIERVTAFGGRGILTERQEELVRVALASGFFDFPRKMGSLELARKLGISVSTLSEIMRATQRRIFSEYVRS
ncbi:helix-turn-helix domain-containing protein [Candidatus Bathyarchaeota archaeon]|nr:helix-turn-helix domain-containing protein [Candidatus Bathyarchaeota archaeon]